MLATAITGALELVAEPGGSGTRDGSETIRGGG
jgi:hypothetical protein